MAFVLAKIPSFGVCFGKSVPVIIGDPFGGVPIIGGSMKLINTKRSGRRSLPRLQNGSNAPYIRLEQLDQ